MSDEGESEGGNPLLNQVLPVRLGVVMTGPDLLISVCLRTLLQNHPT